MPIRTVSESNLREHWTQKNKRRAYQRYIVKMMLFNLRPKFPAWPDGCTVTLTRIASRRLDDDNLARSFKAVRDEVADFIGIDDGSEKIRWVYEQEKGRPKEYAVRLKIEP